MKKVGAIGLLELCIAALILMLAGATTVQLFVRADGISRETETRTQAMLVAQSCAQRLNASEDMMQTLLDEDFAKNTDDVLEKQLDNGLTLRVNVAQKEMAVGQVEEAWIEVIGSDETLCELPAVRYDNKEVIHP